MSDFVLKYTTNQLWYGCFSHFPQNEILHGVSTRVGGASKPPFSSLNLGLHTGDDADTVCFNRNHFCQAVGVDFARIVTAEQTHGDSIAVVNGELAGKGATIYSDSIKNTDALITNTPNLPLMLFFADCVPILIYDPIHKSIGISHAGWKGTVAKIAQKTILAMHTHFGTNPADCLIGIAPSVGPCCYEVDDTVVKPLMQNFDQWSALVIPKESKWQLNLWKANQMQLEEIGVKTENIAISNVCTACNTELFFSYRVEHGKTGRMGAVISIL